VTAARLLDVPAAAIRLTPANPRTDGAEDLDGLVASLSLGLAQRPTLIEVEPGVFEVLTGERRVRAGLVAGWTAIPAVVEDVLDPLTAHTRRVSENLHRKDLNPLDEARALKLDWLNANVLALGLAGEAGAALSQAGSVRAGLAAVAAVLEAAQWSPSRPNVTQEAYLESRGLGISKAAMRKKLQLLNLSDAAQERIDALGLTEAGIRAFMRLDVAQQDALLAALDADPSLARKVKTILQDLTAARSGPAWPTMRRPRKRARGRPIGNTAPPLRPHRRLIRRSRLRPSSPPATRPKPPRSPGPRWSC
jgi:hypothetical protein